MYEMILVTIGFFATLYIVGGDKKNHWVGVVLFIQAIFSAVVMTIWFLQKSP